MRYCLNVQMQKKWRRRFIDEAFDDEIGDEGRFVDEWYMTPEQIRIIANSNNSTGFHEKEHEPFTDMSCSALREELTAGKRVPERIIRGSVSSISYPFGGKLMVTRREAMCAASAGFEWEFTMERAVNCSLEDGLLLARMDCNDLPVVGKNLLFELKEGDIYNQDGRLARRHQYIQE